MSSLPTCWYCPHCRRIELYDFDPGNRGHWNQDTDNGTEEWCQFDCQQSRMIPPGTPPEQILNLVGDVEERGVPVLSMRGVVTSKVGWFVIPREEAKG